MKHSKHLRTHGTILLVFAMLFIISLTQLNFTGLTIADLNISEDNATEVITETLTNITEELNNSVEESLINITNDSIANETTIEITNESNISEITTNITEEIIENTTIEIINESNITKVNNTTEIPDINITNVTETNISEQENKTIEPNITSNITENITIIEEQIVQYQAVIGKPVKWKKTIKLENETNNLEIELPKDANIISIKEIENNQTIDITDEVIAPTSNLLTGLSLITGFAVIEESSATSIIIEQNVSEIEIEYETEAPQVVEEETTNGKRVTVSSETHYKNILTYTSIKDAKQDSIKLFRIVNGTKVSHSITDYKDTDNSGKIDEIYWITPHLSNETFEISIIEVSRAIHLDSNYTFIADVYEQVKALDNNWTSHVQNNEYLRITFKKNLTANSDITLYAKGNNSKIEVYEVNSSTKITEFQTITTAGYYKVLLTNLQNSQDTFDLKIINGYTEFDYIVDPAPTIASVDINTTDPAKNDTNQNITIYPRTVADTDGDFVTNVSAWYFNLTPVTIFNLVFDKNDSTNITDYSGNNLISSVSTVTWSNTTSAIPGGAYVFNESSTQRIQVLHNASMLQGNRSFSLEVWFNASTYPGSGAFDYLVCKEPSSGTSGYCLRLANVANLTFFMSIGGSYRFVSQQITATQNRSHHVVATWNESNMTLWFDGIVRDARAIKGNVNTNTQNITIGNWNGNGRAFNGTIDIVRMYNRSLTAEEILYLNGSNGTWETMVPQETELGENWSACVTPVGGDQDGTRVCSQSLIILDSTPDVTLNNPPDVTSNSSDSHRFNTNYSDDVDLFNATLYHNISGSWVANQTVTINGTTNSTNFSVANITTGNYVWNVQVCDNSSKCNQANSNFTFTVTTPGVVNVTSCREISDSGTYLLNRTISNNTICITINTSDVDFNCAGNTVIYGGSGVGRGFNLIGTNNITVRQCIIEKNSTTGTASEAILLSSLTNSFIINNTIRTNSTDSGDSFGIGFSGINNTNATIANNTIRTIGNSTNADFAIIYSISTVSTGFNISGNTIVASAGGIYLFQINNTLIALNNIDANAGGLLLQAQNGTILYNTTIRDNIINASGTGIDLFDATQQYNITSNTITVNGTGAGILLRNNLGSPGDNNITNNTITSTSSTGAGIQLTTSDNNTFINNRVNASNVEASDYISDSGSARNLIINLTLTRPGFNVTFKGVGGITLKGILSTEPQASRANAGTTSINKFINITNSSAGANIFLNITYTAADVSGLNESEVRIWKYNDSSSRWVRNDFFASRGVDTTNNIVFANITSFSTFGAFEGAPPTIQSVDINSSDPSLNTTDVNITIYIRNVTNGDDGIAQNVTNWYVNGVSWTSLYLPFEGGSSNATFTKDYSAANGSNNGGVFNGTVNGATFNATGGIDGFGAYTFDGVNDGINVSNAADLIVNFTITAWVNTTGSNAVIISRRTNAANAQYFFDTGSGGGGVGMRMYNGSVTRNSNTNITNSRWYHIVAAFNDTSVQFYVNGVADGQNTMTLTRRTVNTHIGVWYPTAGSPSGMFNGTINDLIIYNRTLTAQQVQALYQNRTDLMVSQETGSTGENWSACVTPIDATTEGTAVCSENITIQTVTCGIALATSGTLESNLSVNGSCLNITGDNVVLNCAGYTIAGNGSGIGINVSLRDNITIRDCRIQYFRNNILMVRTNNSLLINNTIENSTAASVSLITNSNNNQILNNTINNSLDATLSVTTALVITGVNNTIADNFILTNRTESFRLSGNGNNTVANNTIISNSSEGLFITPGTISTVILVINNTIYTNESSGVFITGNGLTPVHNISIINNRISGGNRGYPLFISTSAGTIVIGNNLTTNGTSSTGNNGVYLDGSNSTFTNNTIADTADIQAVFYIAFGGNNTISYNTISTVNGTALFVDGGETTIGESFLNNTLISNNLTLRLRDMPNRTFINTVLRTNNTWITTEAGANNVLNNTIFDTPNGSIRIPGTVTIPQRTTMDLGNLNISHNRTFLNSTNLSFLNGSGIVTLRSITFTNPRPTIDTEDDGTYRNCNAPECNELSFSGNIFIYNTTHFSSHSSQETDSTNPSNITLVNPSNNTANESTSHIFFSNASDNLALENATLYHNINSSWVANQTANRTGTFNTSSFNVSNIAAGTYTWNVRWCDAQNNCAFASSNFTLTVQAAAGGAIGGGGNTASSAGRSSTTIEKPKVIVPPTPKARINITESPIKIRDIITGTIKTKLPLKIRTIDWGFLLIIAIALAIWIIKKELKQLKKYEVKAVKLEEDMQISAHKARLHIFRNIVKTLTKSVRVLAVSVEDISHAIGLAIYAVKRRRIKLARLAALTKARYVRSLEKIRLLITIKQLKEEKLLALEKARRERLARLELLKKRQLEIKNRIEAIRTRLLQSASLTEKDISDIESVFKSSLPYLPELQPHLKVKAVSQYENDSNEFRYLYNKVDEHIKENNLEAAKEAYDALILIFNQLIHATTNKYELISIAKEIQSRLSLAILSARAREKIENYKALNEEIEIEKLPLQIKYGKEDRISEEELQIDYLKALLKKNNYKKAIALYNELYKEKKKLISTPKSITPIELKGIKNIKYKKIDSLPAEGELKFDYLRQLLKDNEYKKAIALYKSINPNFSRLPVKTPTKIKPIEIEDFKPVHHSKEKVKQQEDLRLAYLRELLSKNEYKEAIKLYESIYNSKKEIIKRPKKVESVFIKDIEPIKYEKLGSLPSESELNIESLRKLLKNNDYKTARKIFNKVFKE